MRIARLLLLSTGLLNVKPWPVFVNVSIGAEGRFRFLVDTGSQTSLIDPALAAHLKLQPQLRAEIITQSTSRLLPGLNMDTLRIGEKRVPELEMIFDEMTEAQRLDSHVVGVLGINALRHVDLALSPRSGTLDISGERPTGKVVPFYWVEERIAIKARMGREDLTLILDSGAPHIVLFHKPEAMANSRAVPAVFGTFEGARTAVPTCWTAEMTIAEDLRFGTLPAAIINRTGTQADGLIPASLFTTIYVGHTKNELVLVR